jgi:hypothetical protein
MCGRDAALRSTRTLGDQVINDWAIERRFYMGMSTALGAVVFVGFAQSFYLRGVFAGGRVLTPLLYVHGVVFSTWIALLATQSTLITFRRPDVHRRLGLFALLLASAMVVLGSATALTLAARLLHANGATAAGRASLALLDLPVFAGLVVAAILLRHRPQAHKRLMLLATIALIGAAINRLPLPAELAGRYARFLLADLFCLSLIVWDLISAARIHAATLAGTSAIILDQIAQASLGQSDGWSRAIARLLDVMNSP